VQQSPARLESPSLLAPQLQQQHQLQQKSQQQQQLPLLALSPRALVALSTEAAAASVAAAHAASSHAGPRSPRLSPSEVVPPSHSPPLPPSPPPLPLAPVLAAMARRSDAARARVELAEVVLTVGSAQAALDAANARRTLEALQRAADNTPRKQPHGGGGGAGRTSLKPVT
jgi:hypothetical protein